MTNEKQNPQMGWQQVVLNGGPPCFALAGDLDTHYCGRAQRWAGHDSHHKFVSLDDLLATVRAGALEAACLAICARCRLSQQFTPAERVGDGKRWFYRAANTSFEDGIASQCDAWPIRNLTENRKGEG